MKQSKIRERYIDEYPILLDGDIRSTFTKKISDNHYLIQLLYKKNNENEFEQITGDIDPKNTAIYMIARIELRILKDTNYIKENYYIRVDNFTYQASYIADILPEELTIKFTKNICKMKKTLLPHLSPVLSKLSYSINKKIEPTKVKYIDNYKIIFVSHFDNNKYFQSDIDWNCK
ncbi:MAG: hypothetical protein ACRC41_10910 [Sarcina sp.]